MTLAEKIKHLRQEKHWTQKELADKIEVNSKQVSAYERGASYPSVEGLLKLATLFDVSLDYLVFDKGEGKIALKDRELLTRFDTLDKCSESEKKLAIEILDLVIMKHKFKALNV